jgi:hypothetical protein
MNISFEGKVALSSGFGLATMKAFAQSGASVRKSIDRMELIHDFLKRAFSGSLHAKRILSLANGTLGVLTGRRWRFR